MGGFDWATASVVRHRNKIMATTVSLITRAKPRFDMATSPLFDCDRLLHCLPVATKRQVQLDAVGQLSVARPDDRAFGSDLIGLNL
jgi:hypothetical protein